MEVGQQFICVKSHSGGLVLKHNIYTILALKPSFCRCKITLIDVGIRTNESAKRQRCNRCATRSEKSNTIWFGTELFKETVFQVTSQIRVEALTYLTQILNTYPLTGEKSH